MAPKKLSGSKPGRNKRKRLAAEKKENADAGMSVVTPRYPLPPKPPLPASQQELPAVATPSVVVPSVPTTQSKISFSSSMKTALEVKPTAIGNTKPTFDDADPVARIPGSARAIPTSTGAVSASAYASAYASAGAAYASAAVCSSAVNGVNISTSMELSSLSMSLWVSGNDSVYSPKSSEPE